MTTERTQVLWLGPPPRRGVQTEFERRGLTLKLSRSPDKTDFFVSRAAIFNFDTKHKGQSIGVVREYAQEAAEHGLLVVLRASRSDEIKLIQSHLLDFPAVESKYMDIPRPVRQFSLKRPGYELAELAARHPAGPRINPDLDIRGRPPEKDGDIFLLKRAFSDCKRITVEPLTKGLSGARVLVVYAEFPPGEAAPYPLPYFAKIDTFKRILTEYQAYDRFVTRYIPFSQRPNCEYRRCLLGTADGILVGDFVDDSVSLSDVVLPYGARAIIHSLFDDALRGWRQQAYRVNDHVQLADIRSKIIDADRIKNAHVICGQEFGAKFSKTELVKLLDQCSHAYRRGPVHGDLNAQNIRVRNGEAVLIDFYKCDYGPLVADLASLEIAICFSLEAEIAWNNSKQGQYQVSTRFREWRRHIDELFTFNAGRFGMVPPLQEQPCAHSWMWSACRQLRLMGQYIESNEEAYGYVLAAYLLRLCMFPDNEKMIDRTTPDSIVRGYAYWCAERILRTVAH